jgi:transcriptional regulator with XRE-family HTH domain
LKVKATRKKRIQHDDVVRAFASQLRELRVKRGLSQLQLAQRAHVNINYVGRLERAAAAPGIDLVGRLAQALEVSINDLLRSAPADALPLIREQARRRFDSILKRADAPTLSILNPWLALLDDALIRSE